MAYVGDDKVLLFGGFHNFQPTIFGDTWVFDLSDGNWTELAPSTAPVGRFDHKMVYIGDDKALLFGGHHGYGNYSSETWVYDLSDANWTLKSPVADPGLSSRHAMARIGDDKAVVFTGSETWVYDLSDNNWTQMSPPSRPSSRVWAGMAYLGDDRAVLFGGETGAFPRTPYGDTWIYDLSDDAWTEHADTPHPSARSYPAACETSLDASTDIVMFSGATGYSPAGTPTVRSKETWTFGSP